MYNFSFHVTEADYLEFNKQHNLASLKTQKFVRVIRVILLILIGFLVFSTVFIVDEPRVGDLVFFGFLAAFVIFGFKPLTLLLVRVQIRTIKKQGKLPFNKDVQLRFDEDSYTEITDVSETKMKYTPLERVVEGPNAVYIYVGAIQATLIPNAAFESEEQKQEFLVFIRSRKPVKIM
ncbi:MAG: YcxB family protein [Defluviitaleaceae bacterium]|nr:YcxB family protein [Defluviitaleaceae bacterium]